ncbi:Putative Rho family, other [Rhizopus microsporus]|nr:Putative Rho family, other [Rhizopus microsporus]
MTRGITRKKLVVVGDGGCGKTSLLVVYQKKEFPKEYVPTVFENYIANVALDSGKMVELALWDTAGQEDFDRLRPLSYPETDVILICFAINLRNSFKNVQDRWLPEVTHFCEGVPKLLVGTKVDFRENKQEIQRLSLSGQTLITTEEGRQMAKEIGADYYECSAMKNINVDLVIEAATKAAVTGSIKKLHRKFCKIL